MYINILILNWIRIGSELERNESDIMMISYIEMYNNRCAAINYMYVHQ